MKNIVNMKLKEIKTLPEINKFGLEKTRSVALPNLGTS